MEYLKFFDFYDSNINFNTNKCKIRGGVSLFLISTITIYYMYTLILMFLYPEIENQFNLEYLLKSDYANFEQTSKINLNFTIIPVLTEENPDESLLDTCRPSFCIKGKNSLCEKFDLKKTIIGENKMSYSFIYNKPFEFDEKNFYLKVSFDNDKNCTKQYDGIYLFINYNFKALNNIYYNNPNNFHTAVKLFQTVLSKNEALKISLSST
jgi:hypothetical protein